MQRVSDEPAHLIHRRAFGESSWVLEFFTPRHGRIALLGKGRRRVGRRSEGELAVFTELYLSWQGRGDLPVLTRYEARVAGPRLRGAATLAGLYCNELIHVLLPRDDPHPELYQAYVQAMGGLAQGRLADTVRRFELELLGALGYGISLRQDADGDPIRAEARYRLDPEHGLVEVAAEPAAYSGAILLALADGQPVDAAGRREQRRFTRQWLRHHLGARELTSWRVLGELSHLHLDFER